MSTATFNKFNSFVADIANKVHNLGSDQLQLALTDVAPVAGNTQLSNITEISYTNVSSRAVTTSSCTQTSGLLKLICEALTLTASGTVPQFRYVVLYNTVPANKNLIAWWDYGAEINMQNSESLAVNFDQSNGVLQIS